MYMNTISFKNGRLVGFRSEIPYSTDKVAEGWNIIVDDSTKAVVSFRGSEIVTLVSELEREKTEPKLSENIVVPAIKKNGKKTKLKINNF
jgi:hypothetical protein